MHKMHPDIKKFWQEAGYIYFENENQEGILGTVTGHLPLGGPFPIYSLDTLAFGDQHRFKGKWYTEEQMLRIIKLKVFL